MPAWRKFLSKSNDNAVKLNILKTAAAGASVSVAVVLSLIKAFAAFSTGSLSVVSSMVDSIADVFSSLVSLIAVRFSNKPFTSEHRYGYGKAEAVSALVQAAFVAGSGAFILYDGFNRFIHPVAIKQTVLGMGIMGVSLLFTIGLILFQRYVVRKTKSLAIKADSVHYMVDLLTNAAIVLSLGFVHYLNWSWFDILTAVFISCYLIYNACQIAVEALSEITDKEVDSSIKEDIVVMVRSVPEVKGFHDFRTRVSGTRMFLEIHLEMDGNLPLSKAHDVSEKVEDKILAAYPQAQVIVHQDPYGLRERRIDHEIAGNCTL